MISSSADAEAVATPHTPRVLGPADPGLETGPPEQQPQQATGPYQNPAALATPQRTVNSSISSTATPAIVGGAGDLATATTALRDAAIASGATPEQLAIIGGTSGAAAPTTLNPMTSGNVTASTNGMSETMSGNVSATPLTTTASAVPSTPSAASAGAAPTTATSTPVAATGRTTTASSTSAPSSTSRVSSAPVQVTTSSNGTVIVTNPTTQGQSRFQRILRAMHLTSSQAAPSDQKQ